MGCARCNQLEIDVRDLLSEMNITAASGSHDFKEIARYNLLGSPLWSLIIRLFQSATFLRKAKSVNGLSKRTSAPAKIRLIFLYFWQSGQ